MRKAKCRVVYVVYANVSPSYLNILKNGFQQSIQYIPEFQKEKKNRASFSGNICMHTFPIKIEAPDLRATLVYPSSQALYLPISVSACRFLYIIFLSLLPPFLPSHSSTLFHHSSLDFYSL